MRVSPGRGAAFTALGIGLIAAAGLLAAAQNPPPPPPPAQTAKPDPNLGYTDTPMLPNLPWHVHDPARPQPPVVTPGTAPGAPPSDAIVLFDGKDLSHWGHRQAGQPPASLADAKWTVREGHFEVPTPRAGDIFTRQSFGDVQVHLEWASPAAATGTSQGRGNSGLKVMGLYEIQILDSFQNRTYADGGAAFGLRAVATTRQRGPQAGRVANVRYCVRGAALRGRQGRQAGVRDALLERRRRARPEGVARDDDQSTVGPIHRARAGAAADASGPRQSCAVPQHLGAKLGTYDRK